MQGITPKQERFAVEYVATGNASEAYRRAYDAGDWTPNAVGVEASRLLDNPKVILKVNEEKERALGPTRVTAADVLSRAWEIASSQDRDRVAALNIAARAFSEFKDAPTVNDNRVVVVEGLSLEELRALAGA